MIMFKDGKIKFNEPMSSDPYKSAEQALKRSMGI
jgi:hypothetical protein